MGAVVARVQQVLGRAHELFGDPLIAGGPASKAGSRLAGAARRVRAAEPQMSALAGEMPTAYGVFATDAAPALAGVAGTDSGLGAALDAAAGADRRGRTDAGAVVAGAAADTAALAAVSATPAGEKALIAALRSRVVQQQQVVAAYRARDAQLAAALRTLTYTGRGAGAGMPVSGGMLRGARSSGVMRVRGPRRTRRAALASRVDRSDRVAASPAAAIDLAQVRYLPTGAAGGPGPAGRAIAAALDARGVSDPAARQAWTQRYLTLITRESTFRPDAVNTTDTNNRGPQVHDGHRLGCSRGLTQMTPGAFAANHQPGTSTNIYDPVANIAASMNRMLTVYAVRADGSDLAAKVAQTDPRRAPHGY